MHTAGQIKKIPWDSKVFGINCYEITTLSRENLNRAGKIPGHYTVKVNPLTPKRILFDCGFYYCDTLVEASCAKNDFTYFPDKRVFISRQTPPADLIRISTGAFRHGRFHRDFNIATKFADARYNRWLKELCRRKTVLGLIFDNTLAGFFAYQNNRIALHAISKKFRGRGLAKYLWSAACVELFKEHKQLTVTFSLANMPIMNVYAKLGFKFKSAKDVYHKYTGETEPKYRAGKKP